MLSQHHLPQLIPNRVHGAINRLHDLIWQQIQPLEVEATRPGQELLSFKQAAKRPRFEVRAHSSWGKLFDQRWCRIRLPKTEGKIWFNWRDQGEATLYIEGQPYFGFDVAHRHCQLPARAREIWIEANCIQSAVWHPDATGLKEGSFFEGAFLCGRNEEAWKSYHDLKCLFEWAMDRRNRENPQVPTTLNGAGLQVPVDKFSPAYRRVLRLMDEAVDVFDLEGLKGLSRKLTSIYAEVKRDEGFMRCVLTGHAHIDLVWMWPERMGELKAVHTFSTVDRLMHEYPEFRFAYSQSASYEAVKRRNPELYQRVLGRIRRGKWQATGAMYVESDTLLACGEALARSFIRGQNDFAEINGQPSRLTWLPDVFGYSACLPQIMKQMGVDYFFTTKMTWNAINRFPHSSFVWKGNDGSEVLAHVTQDCGYNNVMAVTEVKAGMNGHQQGDIHPEYLLPTGYGDGGGGPTAEMCERARRLSSLPGMPAIVWDQPEAFFDRLALLKNRLPVHQGECYLEVHRGTFTTHGNLKNTFRKLEGALYRAEAVAAITGKSWDMESAWKSLVFSQFHDYIPGSSVWDVYLEGLPKLEKETSGQEEKTLGALTQSRNKTSCLFNPHALPVRRWVRHPKTGKQVFVSLPALSGTPIGKALSIEEPVWVEARGKTVSNGLAEFHLDANGWVDQLSFGGRSVPMSGSLGQLILYPDRSAVFEAWDVDRQVLALGRVYKGRPSIVPFQEGGRRAGFRVTRKIGRKSTAVVTYSLTAGSALLDIDLDLDWQEPEHLVKMVFPTAYAGVNARFGCPFGSVLRPQVSNGLVAEAMWEVPFSRYLAVFDEGERNGLFVATECKYGATVRDGQVGLSLVRSPRLPGFDFNAAAWPAHLSRLKIPSPCSDLGEHHIRLALGHYHLGLSRTEQPAAVAETHFTKPLAYEGVEHLSPLESISGDETLIPAWAKPSGNRSWILRLHEVNGNRGRVKLVARKGWKLEITNLAEKKGKKLGVGGDLAFSPYQILSVRFEQV